MNKKGFTMIEIMAALIVLTVIMLIAFPTIIRVIKETGGDIDESTEALIKSATKNYVEKYKNNYRLDTNLNECITIDTLIKENLLIDNLKEGTNGDKIDVNRGISITVDEGLNYKFELLDEGCPE